MQKKYERIVAWVQEEITNGSLHRGDKLPSENNLMEHFSVSRQTVRRAMEALTEKGVVDRLKRDYPDKEFTLIKENLICESMKLNTLEDIYNSLNDETYEIKVDREISQKALKCIEKMLDVSKVGAAK